MTPVPAVSSALPEVSPAPPLTPAPPVDSSADADSGDSEPVATSSTLAPGKVDCRLVACVALTFDDGPGPYTEEIVAILDEYDARATFYVVGLQLRSWPNRLPLVVEAGHEIGNHTENHPTLSQLGVEAQQEELEANDQRIVEETGILPGTVRPPFGDIPRGGIPDPENRPVVMWSVDSLDWRLRSSQKIVDEVLGQVGPGDIILMHELYRRSVDALPEILQGLSDRGLTVVTVSELLGPDPQPGPVTRVPFDCAVLATSNDIDSWCIQHPDWQPAGN